MEQVVIELLTKIGLGKYAVYPGIGLYCRKLNEYTNDKFKFAPYDKSIDKVSFYVGMEEYLLTIDHSVKQIENNRELDSINYLFIEKLQ